MTKIQAKLVVIGLIAAVGIIAAIIFSIPPAAGPAPCVNVANVFVDIDGDGDGDLLLDGCAIFNVGQLSEATPLDQFQGLVPTPPVMSGPQNPPAPVN